MKHFATLLLLLASSSLASAVQAQISGKSVHEFKTTAGTAVHIGDTLHLGRGTLPTGEFQYVFVPDNVFTGSKRVNFTSQMSNLSVRVKDIRVQQSKLYGSKTVAVIRANTINGCVDLDAAEGAGEIITANTRRSAVSAAGTAGSGGGGGPPVSTADELLKLKKLYDQKILTKAEYETQKARLLK